MKKWLPILVLGLTQFVMVLDGTVMNVSITEVVGDLGTTTSNMQLAIATFTLTMAALMLAGAGLGTRLGLRRTFVIGNVIYAIGSLTTAFAPGFAALFVGWSLVEGLGAALVVPAIAALAAVNYSGRERAMAYAVLGGIAGAASAAGPLIGGWMTTYLSWRWVFGFETLIILLLVLPLHRRIVDQRPTAIQGRFDWPGVLLSALSMGLIVLALVSASTWGLIQPINPPFTVWGFSPTMPMVVVGALVAWGFISWQEHLQTHGGAPLVGLDLLSLASLRAGLASQLVLYFIVAGTFFVIPLYLQTVLELNALESGIRMLPMSVCLFLVALIGSRLASHRSPRQLIRSGLLIRLRGPGVDDQRHPPRSRQRAVHPGDGLDWYRHRPGHLSDRQRQPLIGRSKPQHRNWWHARHGTKPWGLPRRGHCWHGPVHCPRQPTHHNGEQQPLDQPCAEAGHRSGAKAGHSSGDA